ncbi:hypothetical protein ACQKWADRAFT_302650 [Trichoderma austrokoningii]
MRLELCVLCQMLIAKLCEASAWTRNNLRLCHVGANSPSRSSTQRDPSAWEMAKIHDQVRRYNISDLRQSMGQVLESRFFSFFVTFTCIHFGCLETVLGSIEVRQILFLRP